MARELQRGVGDVAAILPYVTKLVTELKAAGQLKNGAIIEANMQAFAQMAADVLAVVKDGFQFSDLAILAKLVPELMGIAKNIAGASGDDKRQFVVDCVWIIYHSVDTGPDGKQNRIKVPFVSWLSWLGIGATEEQVERLVLKLATEFAIEAIYTHLKKP